MTRDEMGGSHFALVNNLDGGQVPTVDPTRARETFAAVHRAISTGLVRACHDLSEGGLAVAVAEMAFAGGLGAQIDLHAVPTSCTLDNPAVRLFSESNSRFLCEVLPGVSDVRSVAGSLAPHGYRLLRVEEHVLTPRPELVPSERYRDWLFTTRSDADLRSRGIPLP
jgi:phosphoribosylformylglycinamidine (FGAM) synthase-like enzyme